MGSVSLNDFTTAFNATDTLSKQHINHTVEGAGLKAIAHGFSLMLGKDDAKKLELLKEMLPAARHASR